MLIPSGIMGLFQLVFFPVALILWGMLLLPLPEILKGGVVFIIDTILFFPVCESCGKTVSLFWMVFIMSTLFMLGALADYKTAQELASHGNTGGSLESNEKMLKKLYKAEKNCWVTLFSFVLVVTIHRFRHTVKHSLKRPSQRPASFPEETARTSKVVKAE